MKKDYSQLTNDGVKNILAIYGQATQAELFDGLRWYDEAFSFCATIADAHNLPVSNVAYACAALSPNNSWTGNQKDLITVCAAFASGELEKLVAAFETDTKAMQVLKVQTYPKQVIKAFNLLKTGNLLAHIGQGKKTLSFARNIAFTDSLDVTIDGHAASIVLNKRMTMKDASKELRPSNYHAFAAAYEIAAAELGILPKQLQAITWVAWRRMNNIGKHKG